MPSPNKQIEDAAIAWVIRYEQSLGRAATDTRGKAPTDIQSPPLSIEVKAYGLDARGEDLWLEVSQFQEAKTNAGFRLYIVENVAQGNSADFTLRILEGDHLAEAVRRAREKKHYELPLPTAVFDTLQVIRCP